MLQASGDLMRLIRSPVLSRDEQGKAMAALAERAGLSPLVRDFLGVVARNRRLFAVPAMIEAFLREAGRHGAARSPRRSPRRSRLSEASSRR